MIHLKFLESRQKDCKCYNNQSLNVWCLRNGFQMPSGSELHAVPSRERITNLFLLIRISSLGMYSCLSTTKWPRDVVCVIWTYLRFSEPLSFTTLQDVYLITELWQKLAQLRLNWKLSFGILGVT